MILGITATRFGLTEAQKAVFKKWISDPQVTHIRHGDCVGGDEESHYMALAAGKSIIIHPPINPRFRAFCTGPANQVLVLPSKSYHPRNRDIVVTSHQMLAGPQSMEVRHGGTWYTIDYALSIKRPVEVVEP